MHGNSRSKKVILGHRVSKVRSKVRRVRKEKRLIKRKVRGHTELEAREARGM